MSRSSTPVLSSPALPWYRYVYHISGIAVFREAHTDVAHGKHGQEIGNVGIVRPAGVNGSSRELKVGAVTDKLIGIDWGLCLRRQPQEQQ
ncbi:MAG: hypothetical protein QM743_07710 [Chitinophagaceae bacterium]